MDQSIAKQRPAYPMLRKVFISFDKSSNTLEVSSQGLVKSCNGGRYQVSTTHNSVKSEYGTFETAKRCKGIIVFRDNDIIRILNDPFCTIPLYYIDNTTQFKASSDPQDLVDYEKSPLDEVGVWETLILNGPLWNRTLFRSIKFLPSACELNVGKEITLKRYWNFEFETSAGQFNQRAFLQDFDDLIADKFSSIHASSIVMGLSGGNDSRLAAHYVARNRENFQEIKFVTYAAHANSNEYRYACEVAGSLGLDKPSFYQLSDEHYVAALDYFPKWTAGQINNLHCHLTSYLREISRKYSNVIQISNYYTDALFGYACHEPEPMDSLHMASVCKDMMRKSFINKNVIEEIYADCEQALQSAIGDRGCFSSFNEFKYIAERNPRFHMSLAFMQGQFIQTILPFADIDLLAMAMHTPLSLRLHKNILKSLLYKVNPKLALVGSSANTEYFYGTKSRLQSGTIIERLTFKKFRFLNLLTQALSWLSAGNARYGNPYQTEDHVAVYRKSFDHLSAQVIANQALRECVGAEKLEEIFRTNVVLRNLDIRFQMIGLHRLTSMQIRY